MAAHIGEARLVRELRRRPPALRRTVGVGGGDIDASNRFRRRGDLRCGGNNVFGMFLPNVISPISGPVLGTNSLSSVWGTAGSLSRRLVMMNPKT